MIRIVPRRSTDVRYYTHDAARELDGFRPQAGWWLRGHGEATNPADVAAVLRGTSRSRVQGYDVIVAAPRPVSVLLAIDESSGAALVRAHREAVAAALRYLEERALSVRVQRGGSSVSVPARWESVVAFTHGVNRHGDPHMHDHVLVGALPDAEETVLDARSLYAHRMAADALYRSHLRFEVARRTRHVPWVSFGGVDSVVGVDEGYRVLWGGHHDSRGVKLTLTRESARALWSRRLQDYEVQEEPGAPSRRIESHGFAAAFEGLARITRRDVIAAWADAQVFGANAGDIQRGVDASLPELAASRGLDEPIVSVSRVRAVEIERWRERVAVPQRSRARVSTRLVGER